MSNVRESCKKRNANPKLAVCITMYNENELELKDTIRGLLENYNEMRNDKELNFKKDDMVVFLIADGYDKLSPSFKKFATDNQFFNEETLREKHFMKQTRGGQWVMKDMDELVEPDFEKAKIPTNCVHLFQVRTKDFGIEEDHLKHRRINFIFAIKQRNDGKINSHKWFFQGLCEYIKPHLCLMLDIGTRPDKHSVYRLYKYMMSRPFCGGCCGEIEVDFSSERGITGSYFIKAA